MSRTKKIRRYAAGTKSTVTYSRTELERLLDRYGADQVVIGTDKQNGFAVVQFRMDGYYVKREVHYPEQTSEFWSDAEREKEWMRRWRALVMIVKAKLEVIASDESTVAQEFAFDVILPDGTRLGDVILPKLEHVYQTGEMDGFSLISPSRQLEAPAPPKEDGR